MTPLRNTVEHVLAGKTLTPQKSSGQGDAPANIALVKYWGKRDTALNLPVTNSLSLSLDQGAKTTIRLHDGEQDHFIVNGQVTAGNAFPKRLSQFLDLFRSTPNTFFHVETTSTVPIAAGLASSAAGFAALVLALDDLFGWALDKRSLSILARLGSGSACRSLWEGFVEWQAGSDPHGMDSHGVPLEGNWPSLRIAPLMVNDQPKPIDSRTAMERTKATSPLYAEWPAAVARDLVAIKQAITDQNFTLLGETAESNALAMHACMQAAEPPVDYNLPETLTAMEKVWAARAAGVPVYFTQDAGPNLKLLYLAEEEGVRSLV